MVHEPKRERERERHRDTSIDCDLLELDDEFAWRFAHTCFMCDLDVGKLTPFNVVNAFVSKCDMKR